MLKNLLFEKLSALFLKLKGRFTGKQFLIFISILVGFTAGFAAVILKFLVYYIHHLLTQDYDLPFQYILLLLFPAIGLIITAAFIKFFLKKKFSKGSPYILHSIAKKSSLIEKASMYTHIITSAITVGFGGSAGLESPIAVTGAAIGSNYGRLNILNYRDRTVLLASGAAAGISAAFNAPIAGVMFALEILLTEVTISTFIPLIISSATGALLSKVILNEEILFFFKLRQPFDYHNVPFYILLGILVGFLSVYYGKVFLKVEHYFKKYKNSFLRKSLIGGSVLAILIYLFPPLFGEGYESVKILVNGNPSDLLKNSILENFSANEWLVLFFIGGISIIKVVATSVTLNSGGNGGNFAPSLFVGAYFGFFFSRLMNMLKISDLPETNFAIVGMAGVLSGVMYAPLTGIFLIAEITGGYELMIPLMIVSAIAYAIVKNFDPYSMDIRELAKKGHIFTDNRDRNILTLLDVKDIIETNFKTVPDSANLEDLTKIIAQSKRNLFPVVNKEKVLLGVINLDDIREFLFDLQKYGDILAVELMNKPAATVQFNEEMSSVMRKFDETGSWNLPILDGQVYVGFISKSTIFNEYRDQLIRNSSE